MKRTMIAVVLSFVFIFGVTLAKPMAHDTMSKSGETSTLLGAMVKNPQGEDLGNIADVVTGPEGQVAFAVIAL
jgi:hypothetical protein